MSPIRDGLPEVALNVGGHLSASRGANTFGFDFDWQDSIHAGGDSPGEFGGAFARTSTHFHYWADTDIGDVTRLDELNVTGKFVIAENPNMDGWIHISYVNTGTGDPFFTNRNELGLTIAQPISNDARFRVSAVSTMDSSEAPITDIRPRLAPGEVSVNCGPGTAISLFERILEMGR